MCPGQEYLYSGFRTSGHARVHAGNIYNQYIPLPTPEKPRPRMLLPFGRDKNFVGREDILESLVERLKDDDYHNRVAISGFGGIGKSQIAIELAYRWKRAHPERWVFWVPSNSRARLIDAYRDIAQAADIEWDAEDLLPKVSAWLSDENNGRWLMVIDNADSRSILFDTKDKKSRPLQSYIPQVSHGCVLITSRNQTGADLSGDVQNTIEVSSLVDEEAVELLRRRIVQQTSTVDLQLLARHLDCIPLALVQAAAYISRTRISVARYLSNLSRNERSEVYHLAQEWDDIRRAHVHNAVLATVWATIRRIRKASPYAAVQLCVMAMFHRQAIPIRPSPRKDVVMGLLLEWAVMMKDIEEHTYTMHRIVQICVKAWIRFSLPAGKKKLEQFRTLAVDELAFMLEATESKKVTQYDHPNRAGRWHTYAWPNLLPHLRILARAKVLGRIRKVAQLTFLRRISIFTQEMCDVNAAFDLAHKLLIRSTLSYPRNSLSRSQKGVYHRNQAINICEVGFLCIERGFLRAAEILSRDMMTAAKRSETFLGHPDRVLEEFSQRLQIEMAVSRKSKKIRAYNEMMGADRDAVVNPEWIDGYLDHLDNPAAVPKLHKASDKLEEMGAACKANELYLKIINGLHAIYGISSAQRRHSMRKYAAFLRRQGKEKDAAMVEQELEDIRDSDW